MLKNAVILTGNLVQDHEFIYPYYRLLEDNFKVDVCINEGKTVKGILGTDIPSKVLEFISHRIISNVREMEGALNRLVAHATLVGTPITVETAQLVLQDLLKTSNKKITIEEIQKKVADHYNIRLTDMHSPRRSRSVARPRQVAMYLAKLITSRSLPEIGRKFGGRDHTTVMHAVKKIEELKQVDTNFNEDIELLKRLIDS